MKNIFILLAIILGLTAIGLNVFRDTPVGSLFVSENAYSGAVTYSTNTLNTGAEEVLVRATSSRTYAEICHSPVNSTRDPVFLFKQSGVSGVAVNSGKAIFATSSTKGSCMRLDTDDPYLGAVFAISLASTTLTIESIQE